MFRVIVEKILGVLWHFQSWEEIKKFLGLSFAYFFLIGAQWPLKITKDCLLVTELGAESQPFAKVLAVSLCFIVALFYNWFVSRTSGLKAIYAIAGFYCIAGFGVAGILRYAAITNPSLIGWLSYAFYVFSESFQAVSIPAFFAFVNDVTTPDEAKRAYPMMICFGQIGGLFATLAHMRLAKFVESISSSEYAFKMAAPLIICFASVLLIAYGLSVWATIFHIKHRFLQGYKPASNEKIADPKDAIKRGSLWKNFSGGLSTLTNNPYVLGILAMVVFQELVVAVTHFRVLKAADMTFALSGGKSSFIASYSLIIQMISVAFSMFGTAWLQRKLGMRKCLIGYPILLVFLMAAVLNTNLAWIVAACAASIRAIYYALGKPVREILYIPTTRRVKYQAKAWIEIFGTRTAKLAGAGVNRLIGMFGTIVYPAVLAVPMVWIVIAHLVGQKYHKTVMTNDIIGEE